MIDSVGPTRRIENLAEAHGAVEISAAGRVVMPGFVDSCASLLSTSQNIPRTAGSVGTITTVEFYTRRLLEICLRHGTTMIESNSIGSDHPQVELRSLRLLDGLDQQLLRVIPVAAVFRASGQDGSAESGGPRIYGVRPGSALVTGRTDRPRHTTNTGRLASAVCYLRLRPTETTRPASNSPWKPMP